MNLRLALLSAILLTIPACRESISSDTADEGGQIADPLVNNALMNADKPTKVEQVTDLYVFLFKHSPSEGRSRLRKILERSPDKTKLAERLLTNYSGEKLDLAINALSMAMYKWPDEYAKAIMRTSRWHPSIQERAITAQASVQEIKGNEKGLHAMYMALEPGGIRARIAENMATLSYSKGGMQAALNTVSDLSFQPERDGALDQVLSQILGKIVFGSHSQNEPEAVAFSDDDYRQVENFTAEWGRADEIRDYLDLLSKHQNASVDER
ncbi:MAG: hypothetical protein ACI9NQ_001961 [Paracoccaceae bacterium]|jgi:hypothetical protein